MLPARGALIQALCSFELQTMYSLTKQIIMSGKLESGPVYYFRDWPNPLVPQISAGVYTIWQESLFLYVGMAGRSLSAEDIIRHGNKPSKAIGLSSRLDMHATGRRSGDQFCVYVSDRLVLPKLSSEEIDEIAAGKLRFDKLVQKYIHEHLSYRFVETPDSKSAYHLEAVIRKGVFIAGMPLLNPVGA
jgi:hypothetical protein